MRTLTDRERGEEAEQDHTDRLHQRTVRRRAGGAAGALAQDVGAGRRERDQREQVWSYDPQQPGARGCDREPAYETAPEKVTRAKRCDADRELHERFFADRRRPE